MMFLKNERIDIMDDIYNEEYFRKIYRENTYIIMQSLFALSVELNISGEARELCAKTVDALYAMIGNEDIVIKVDLGD